MHRPMRGNLVWARGYPDVALAADYRFPQRRRLTPHVLQQLVQTLRVEGPILEVKKSKVARIGRSISMIIKNRYTYQCDYKP